MLSFLIYFVIVSFVFNYTFCENFHIYLKIDISTSYIPMTACVCVCDLWMWFLFVFCAHWSRNGGKIYFNSRHKTCFDSFWFVYLIRLDLQWWQSFCVANISWDFFFVSVSEHAHCFSLISGTFLLRFRQKSTRLEMVFYCDKQPKLAKTQSKLVNR